MVLTLWRWETEVKSFGEFYFTSISQPTEEAQAFTKHSWGRESPFTRLIEFFILDDLGWFK